MAGLVAGEALVTGPATNYRSFTLTTDDETLTPDHTSPDLETRGHRTLSTPDTQETLAPRMQTPHRNTEYSWYSDIIYFLSGWY